MRTQVIYLSSNISTIHAGSLSQAGSQCVFCASGCKIIICNRQKEHQETEPAFFLSQVC